MNQKFPAQESDKVIDQPLKAYLINMRVTYILLLGKILPKVKLVFNSKSEGKTVPFHAVEAYG
jgi:hypothetical protein